MRVDDARLLIVISVLLLALAGSDPWWQLLCLVAVAVYVGVAHRSAAAREEP